MIPDSLERNHCKGKGELVCEQNNMEKMTGSDWSGGAVDHVFPYDSEDKVRIGLGRD